MSGWFRETRESMRMLEEERAKLAAAEAKYQWIGEAERINWDGSRLLVEDDRGDLFVPAFPIWPLAYRPGLEFFDPRKWRHRLAYWNSRRRNKIVFYHGSATIDVTLP